MSATLGMNKVNVQMFGETTQVPNDIVAKLMYYLNCVTVVIDYQKNNILTDYKHYYDLSAEQIAAVFEFGILFDPKIFINAGVFIVDSKLLPYDSDNQFYKITDEKIGVHVNQNFMIGGKEVKVLNVMACNDSWLSRFYYAPIREIKLMMNTLIPGREVSPVVTTEHSMNSSSYIQGPIINAPTVPVIIREFKNKPISITCRFCRNNITTKTEESLNLFACCCCLFLCPLYVCYKCLSDKDGGCFDYTHSCPRCGAILGKYKAC